MPRRILIAGLGLIGGSAGMALRGQGWRVHYLDPNVTLEDARKAGAADARANSLDDGEHDVVLVATPLDVALELVAKPVGRAVVTSACSVMRPLRGLSPSRFVAGHPLAGSHERSLAAASPDLFAGRTWFVDAEDEHVETMVRDCGAVIERIDAATHDQAMALVSHLPQILSTALAAHLHDHDEVLRHAGTGLRTFLRLAGSDASIWAPVIEANRDQLAPHAAAVARLVREIIEGDSRDAFTKAQSVWRKL